jgi:hypothetical protein
LPIEPRRQPSSCHNGEDMTFRDIEDPNLRRVIVASPVQPQKLDA